MPERPWIPLYGSLPRNELIMKTKLILGCTVLTTLGLVGCGDSGPKATAQDKATLDRVSKEGLGPPPASDPYQNTNKQGGLPGNPPPPGS